MGSFISPRNCTVVTGATSFGLGWQLPGKGLGNVKVILETTLLWVAQDGAEVADEDTSQPLGTLKEVALTLAHMLGSIHQAIINPLRAVVCTGLVMEVDDIQSEVPLVCAPFIMGQS